MRLELGIKNQQAVSEALGMVREAYREKVIGVRNKFNLNELPKLREYFEKMAGEQLPGWPIIDLHQARLLAGVLDVARRSGPLVDGGKATETHEKVLSTPLSAMTPSKVGH
ncbi:MAG: hypothetical protein RJA59_1365 [Pseudomonadota bacterium]